MKIEDFATGTPRLLPEEFLAGDIEGWAILEGPLGGIQKRATIQASGAWTEADRLLAFREVWTFDDGHVDTLAWAITKEAEGRYSGEEGTLDGQARGEAAGCAFHWTYTRNVPGRDGGSTKLNFEDWFLRIDEAVVIVKGTAGRLGLPFASAHVTYRRR